MQEELDNVVYECNKKVKTSQNKFSNIQRFLGAVSIIFKMYSLRCNLQLNFELIVCKY